MPPTAPPVPLRRTDAVRPSVRGLLRPPGFLAAPPGRAGRASLRRAAPALLGYLAVRLLGTAVLHRWAHAEGHGLWPTLATSWDSDWYLGIADHGYADELGTRVEANNLAFFPLYPVLVRAVAAVVPGSPASTGLVLAVLCSVVAAWGVFAVGDLLHGRRAGTALAVLWGSLPVAAVQWMGYTESLFTALCAWSLYAVLAGHWVRAGSLAALAGLTRPTGVAVAAAVVLSAAYALYRRRCRLRRVLAGALIAPLGWFGYIGWVGHRLGRWDGYFAVQRLWKNQWDGGAATLRALRDLLVRDARPELFLVVVSLTLITSVVLYGLSAADRQPLPLLVFSGVLLLVVLGSGGVYFPRARFLLPAFPLLLPLALAVARARLRVALTVLGSAAAASAWLGGYMLLTWGGPP